MKYGRNGLQLCIEKMDEAIRVYEKENNTVTQLCEAVQNMEIID